MIAHTPTPWRVEQDTTLIWGACNPDDMSNYGMGYPVAECRITPISMHWAKGPNADQGEANAELIVKAVNSYASLISEREEMVKALRNLERASTEVSRLGATTGPQWPRLTGSLISARALLSRIEGGKS